MATVFCKHCGAEMQEGAAICTKCGFAADANTSLNGGDLANEPAKGGFVALSIIIPLVGIILGIVNMSNGKKHAGKVYLLAAIITWAVCIVLSIIMVACSAAMVGSYY